MRGRLRSRDHAPGRARERKRSCGSAATATTSSATASSARRARRSSSSTRIPTACARRSCAATASSSPRPGTRPSPRSSGGSLPIIEEHGRDAVGVYLGNPTVHNIGSLLYGRLLLKALGTGNLFSASTVDQRPKEISAGLMFGHQLSIPVPDLDRTDYLLLLGANPCASNGSLATAPDWPGRLEAIIARGGRVVVIDPRRTRTAEAASEHHAIVPGTDAHLLFAIVHTLFDEDLVDLGAARRADVEGRRRGRAARARLRPGDGRGRRAASTPTPSAGSRASSPRADRAVVYGRIGTTHAGVRHARELARRRVQRAHREPRPPGRRDVHPRRARRREHARDAGRRAWRQARRAASAASGGSPRRFGELPGGVPRRGDRDARRGPDPRARSRSPGNPVLSIPNGDRLDAALDGLDFMVSFDIYVNETTRHADVILPSASPLAKSHYDLALLQLAIRNVANYSPPVAPARPRRARRLGDRVASSRSSPRGSAPTPTRRSPTTSRSGASSTRPWPTSTPRSTAASADELLDALAPRTGPERILDFMARTGPYGDGFGAPGREGGLTLDVLLEHPHGIDFGPLEPRLPEVLRTPSGHDRARARRARRRHGAAARVARPRARRARARRPARPALEQLVDAQRERAREGQGRGAPSRSTPTTRRASTSPTGPTRRSRRAPARSWCRSRSPTASAPAS